MSPAYPIYRSSADGAHRYRIEGPDRFTELQRVGGRWLRHVVLATAYPEKVRLFGLVERSGGELDLDGPEFDRLELQAVRSLGEE